MEKSLENFENPWNIIKKIVKIPNMKLLQKMDLVSRNLQSGTYVPNL